MTTTPDHDTVAALRAAAAVPPLTGGVDLDLVRRRGEGRRRRSKAARGALASGGGAAVVVLAVVLGAGLVGPVPGPDAAPAPGRTAGPDGSAGPSAKLTLLALPRTPQDALPTVMAGADREGDVVASTSRLVLRQDGVSYFAGTDGSGQVCLVVHLEASDVTATGCASAQRSFEEFGTWVSVSGPSRDTATALLVPDSATPADVARIAAGVGGDLSPDDHLSRNLYAVTTGTGPGQGPEVTPVVRDDLLGLPARPAGPDDEGPGWPPGSESREPGDVAPDTVRRVGVAEGTEFWVSANGLGGVCLLHHVLSEDGGGSSCTTAEEFASRGLAIPGAVSDEGTPLTVVLVPDAWTAAAGGDGSELNRIGLEEAEDTLAPNLLARPHDG